MSGKPGYKGKASLGASDKIAEMGNWKISGAANDLLEDSQLGDETKTYQYGQKEGGTVTFDGHYDPDDANGQTALITAWQGKTKITQADNDPRLYYSDTGYFGLTSGAECLVETVDIDVDQKGIGHIAFTLKVSGGYFEKKA